MLFRFLWSANRSLQWPKSDQFYRRPIEILAIRNCNKPSWHQGPTHIIQRGNQSFGDKRCELMCLKIDEDYVSMAERGMVSKFLAYIDSKGRPI